METNKEQNFVISDLKLCFVVNDYDVFGVNRVATYIPLQYIQL